MTVLKGVRLAMVGLGWAIEPLGATVFLVLWLWAEAGRGDVGIGMMVGFAAAIGLARLQPVASSAIVPGVVLLQACGILPPPGSTDWPVYLGIALAVGAVAAHARKTLSILTLVVGGLSTTGAAALMVWQRDGWLSWIGQGSRGDYFGGWSAVGVLALFGLGAVLVFWGAGTAVRLTGLLANERLGRLGITRRLAQSEIELAVAQERNRIAQEMHDVLAHSLAVIVAQADGARYVSAKRPAAAKDSLAVIAEAARAALGDVHGLIDGILDGSSPPQPGVADVAELVAGIGSAGVETEFSETGDRHDLAPGQQLAVYRIVQEALTNALRHRGAGSSASVSFDWRGPGLSVLVVSEGGDPAPSSDDRVHRGLDGMRERARLAGGWLSAGFDDDGAHRVTAFLPYRLPATAAVPIPIGHQVAA